jgi:hypothetical protein
VTTTANAQAVTTANPIPERASVPIKKLCTMAATNASQLNQWMNRHELLAMRAFIRLEAHTANIRSNATAPTATSQRL